ncbi:hypothetical protein J7M28_04525 [bacterium]|nr:hypothetical protein [bacterium]
MITLVLVGFGVAVLSLIFCGIIAPTIHDHLRYRLFEIRDHLREVMYERPDDISLEQAKLLHYGINNSINSPGNVNFYTCHCIKKSLDQDDSLRKRVEDNMKVIWSCESEQFKLMHAKAMETLLYALLVNVTMWFVLLIPVALIIYLLGRFGGLVYGTFFVPCGELDRPALART